MVMKQTGKAFYGAFIHSLGAQEVEIIANGLIILDASGKIISLSKDVTPDELSEVSSKGIHIEKLKRGELFVPGFIDTHNHAPQWAQRGMGREYEILEWLNTVTFPHESRFEDPAYARRVYALLVEGFLKQGVTTASYYGSLHCEATKILADICLEKGQRALVGKCNMARECPGYYSDKSNATSLQETEELINHIHTIDPEGSLVKPVLTPRFAICCDEELLAGLGNIAKRDPSTMIQTHFVEARQEIARTKELFPQFSNEADLYESFGLFNDHTIMAHCIWPTDYEVDRMLQRNIGVAHCPVSNTTGGEWGAAPIRRYLDLGMKVGLGTDSGGGFSSSILDAMRQAIITSNARQTHSDGKEKTLSVTEVFHLATLGGAKVCCLDDKIGSFAVGKDFDALRISMLPETGGASSMVEDEDGVEVMFEKFVMTGDDRNIASVYVRGRSVK
ncbi:hypothetical protein LTR85_003328 [Meristemomyces frigidus]|nr:hypothetical protein LTR85_003328 [Meristemomyces frigidus]